MTERIFERFFQVNNSVNSELSNTGTGIGLSLSLNIVKAHHGQITVESEVGKVVHSLSNYQSVMSTLKKIRISPS